MDSTATTEQGEVDPYVSCITVDGQPILPPLMTEAKRAEMRFYRQLAVEKELQQKNKSETCPRKTDIECQGQGQPPPSPIDLGGGGMGSSISSSSPLSVSYTRQVSITSTPGTRNCLNSTGDGDVDDTALLSPEGHPSLQGQSLRTRLNFVESQPQQGQMDDLDGDLNENINPDEEVVSDNESTTSTTPSTAGTFIISRGLPGEDDLSPDQNEGNDTGSQGGQQIEDVTHNPDQELSDEDEDEDIHRPEPRTVVRRLVFPAPAADLISKRKRPTHYFDNDEEVDEGVKGDKIQTNPKPDLPASPSEDDNTLSYPTGSTSLSKYMASTGSPPGFNFTPPTPPISNLPLPNLVELDINRNSSPPQRRTDSRPKKSPNFKSSPSPKRPGTHNSDKSNLSATKAVVEPPSSSVLTDISNLRNYSIAKEAPKTPTRSGSGGGEHDERSSALRSVIFSEGSFPRSPPFVPKSPLGQGQEKMGNVGLSKFQNKMQQLNPALLKQQLDTRSPLLKGLVFPDPLERSSAVPRTPLLASDPSMKPKFDRITAIAKGYLTRRLLRTEKIQTIIQTIRDTVELLLKLYEENPPNEQGLIEIKLEDQGLHTRLVQQLTGACSSFNDIFFKISTKERMAIIAHDREKVRAKALRNVLDPRGGNSPIKRNISSATLKSIERRQTESRSPGKKDNQRNQSNSVRYRRSTLKPSTTSTYNASAGSQTVKAKGVKSYNVSPKRRRMSYMWGGGGGGPGASKRTTASARNGDQNDNNVIPRRPFTAAAATMYNRNSQRYPTGDFRGEGSETFLVPVSTNTYNVWPSSSTSRQSQQATITKSSYSTNPNRPSMTRISATVPSTATNRSTTSRSTLSNVHLINRVPWKK